MENGQESRAILPPPWEPSHSTQHQAATPHVAGNGSAPYAPPTITPNGTATLPLPQLPADRTGPILAITPVEPSPDLGMADDPSMSLENLRDADEQVPPTASQDANSEQRETHNDDSAEEDDDDDDEDEEEEDNAGHVMQYYPFAEDHSVPSEEEMRLISGISEHSATNNKYWQAKTFFDIKDPEVLAGESGIIEWTIDAFNGTKENPRKELLLRSPTVRIGNHDWRIKVLPRGHLSTDRVSVYVECATLQEHVKQQDWPEEQLSIPPLSNAKLPKRRSVAAQLSVLMYNPDEPRVHEFRSDAHQFHPGSPDHGWPRFTTAPWYEMHHRSYMARQPLLRNDKIALKAFIRIVYDPTGCLWSTPGGARESQDAVEITGLQKLPVTDDIAFWSVVQLWLHLRPFRKFIYQLANHVPRASAAADPGPITVLQAILYLMRARYPGDSHGASRITGYVDYLYQHGREGHDVMQTMNEILCDLETQLKSLALDENTIASAARCTLDDLFGSREMQFAGSRITKLPIVGKTSVQEAVTSAEEHLKPLASPQLLTLELDRQHFDREKRGWKKILDKVRLDDEINVHGTTYTLYGFATHTGYLLSGKYNSYFRPNGLGNLWYSYTTSPPMDKAGQPECLTMTKAVGPRQGVASGKSIEEPSASHDRSANHGAFSPYRGGSDGVAYVVLYVRNDVASETFYMSNAEPWDVPRWISDDVEEPGSATWPPPTGSLDAALAYFSHDSDPAIPGAQDTDTDMVNGVDGVQHTGRQACGDTKGEPESNDGRTMKHEDINYLSQPFYSGGMQGGDHQGLGHLIYLNGDEYTGNFHNGYREGAGKMVYQNGDVYEGSWKDDLHDGTGVFSEKRTGNVYKGCFKEGKKYGEGTTIWKISEEQARLCQICFCFEANMAFYDCGHVVACGTCARSLDICPVCRRKVRDVLRLFYTA
ncbi:hypothetical protein AAFC00_003452 [Neodothiora populina]